MVLVWPAVGWVEQEGLARIVAWCKDLKVGAEVNDADAFGIDTKPIAQRASRVLGDRNHEIAVSSRSPIDKLAIGELGLREELGQVLMLDIKDRRHGWNGRDAWNHRAEREVQNVKLVDVHLATNATTSCERRAHCVESAGR